MNFLSMLTGSFAYPAAENPTVAMVEAAYRHHRIDARYLNCEVVPAGLADAVRGARAMGWVGFNCSLPHKVAVVAMLDQLAPSASVIGAVNCVVRHGNSLVGENTDGQGFMTSLRTVIDPAGLAVVILGAGGAARAIAVELALSGAAQLEIVNRDIGRARELARLVRTCSTLPIDVTAWAGTYTIQKRADLIINATPVGLFPDVEAAPDIQIDSLRPDLVVADVIPNPPQTRLLRLAEQAGCTVLDGLGMLVNQGRIAINHWTGTDPDPEVMHRALAGIFRSPDSAVAGAAIPSAVKSGGQK